MSLTLKSGREFPISIINKVTFMESIIYGRIHPLFLLDKSVTRTYSGPGIVPGTRDTKINDARPLWRLFSSWSFNV